MKLYDYLSLMSEGNELTVWDNQYDIKMYFYNNKPDDEFDKYIWELTKLLDIKKICKNGVIVNLSELIESKLDQLKDKGVYVVCNMEIIMSDMPNIISGYVHWKWLRKFVNVLSDVKYW